MEKNPHEDELKRKQGKSDNNIVSGHQKKAASGKRKSAPAYIIVIAVLAIILAAVAFIEFGLNGERFKVLQNQTTTNVKSFQRYINQQEQTIAQLKKQLLLMHNVQQRILLQLANNSAGIERLMRVSFASHEQWVLDEAVHLVRLADYYLSYNHNIEAATALLQAADQRISRLGEPSLLTIRQLLADKITALNALPKTDIAGLMVKLNALSDAVAELPLLQTAMDSADSDEKNSATAEEKPSSTWRKAFANGWQQLQKVIVIRHSERDIKPMLSNKQKMYLVQNIQLLLQQAQWAALQEKPEVYQMSLQQASKLVKKYFEPNAPATENALNTIAQLQQLTIKPKVPDLSLLIITLQGKQKQSLQQNQPSSESSADATKPSTTNGE